MPIRALLLLFSSAILLILFASSSGIAETIDIQTISDYLSAGNIQNRIVGRDSLIFKTSFPDGAKQNFLVRSDPKHHCLYIAITELGILKSDDPSFCKKARILMTLNYKIALAKLEWDESSGEIRLSKMLETEDGVSQSRFLKSVRTLLLISENLKGKIK